jgi:hypothetical protein
MLRAAEIGLFLTPLGLYLMWRFLAPHVRPAVLWVGMVLVVGLAGMAVRYGLKERMDPNSRYVPARIEDGRIVPGRGVSDRGVP